MATKKANEGKLTRDALDAGLMKHHAAMVDAVHGVLKTAGLDGVQVHSIRFSMPSDLGQQCDPPCTAGFTCKLDSNGGHVHPVCVKDV